MIDVNLQDHAVMIIPRHLSTTVSGPIGRAPRRQPLQTRVVAHLHLVTIVVDEYDPAIRFFVDVLGFEPIDDSASLTNDGRPKRWVVVRPPGAQTGILLARADGPDQERVVGDQVAGRVGFFLRVDDFQAAYQRLLAAGVEFVRPPRDEVRLLVPHEAPIE